MDSKIDFGQVLQNVYDPDEKALAVELVGPGSSSIIPIYVTSVAGTVIYTFAIPFSSINGNGGSFYQLVASTSHTLTEIIPYDTTGVAIGLYTGGSGSEVLAVNMGPGYDVTTPLAVPVATRLSIRALGAAAPVAGIFFLQLIG